MMSYLSSFFVSLLQNVSNSPHSNYEKYMLQVHILHAYILLLLSLSIFPKYAVYHELAQNAEPLYIISKPMPINVILVNKT